MTTIILIAVGLMTLAVLFYLLMRYETRYMVDNKLLGANSINKLRKKVAQYESKGYVCVTEPFAIKVGKKIWYYQQVHNEEQLRKQLSL